MNPAENYILKQEEPFRSILLHLQAVIEHILPDADLKFKYRIPFYYLDGKPCCYLNRTKDYIDLGFWHGTHLSVHLEHLVIEGRKVIRSLRYKTLEEIDETVLRAVLKDAHSVKDKKFER